MQTIAPDLKANDRWAAFTELLNLLVEGGKIKDYEQKGIYELLVHRENMMTTGIGHGIAIPHASYDQTEEVIAAFGRSRTGIQFEALDGQPVYYVAMIIVPKAQFQTHLKTLSILAKYFNNPANRQAIDNARTVDELSRCFEVAEV
ncbi:MAG: PTS sugar transporter subunit IIA [Verrucomicrobiae bacterium]|nr:PTS sugar transporter subunit IIA [Verrucomicrobiae bacterium]